MKRIGARKTRVPPVGAIQRWWVHGRFGEGHPVLHVIFWRLTATKSKMDPLGRPLGSSAFDLGLASGEVGRWMGDGSSSPNFAYEKRFFGFLF